MQVLTLKAQPRNLLVPVSMVAQILGHEKEDLYAHSLPFINSCIQWREFRVPLVYASHMLGAPPGSDRNYERAVVLWPMEGTRNTDLFALTSMDSPKVVTIGEESGRSDVVFRLGEQVHGNVVIIGGESGRSDAPEEAGRTVGSDYVLGGAKLEGAEGLIPDLSALARDIFSV